MARVWPAFRFAYSRPGFVTFKLPPGSRPPDDLDLKSVFARAYGFSLGKAAGATANERVESTCKLLADRGVQGLHVWPRDTQEPGYRDYTPGMTPEALAICQTLQRALAPLNAENGEAASGETGCWGDEPCVEGRLSGPVTGIESMEKTAVASIPQRAVAGTESAGPARRKSSVAMADRPASRGLGCLTADVVLVDENEWWVGYHRTHSVESAWAGGFFPEVLPADAVSRAYLKMREALIWSGMEIEPGTRVAEIGCSPGGSSQALLAAGAHVLGIDPADVAPQVLGHPRFRHLRRRSKEVRRREFLAVDWLTCDINLPPNYTLDTVEAIVSYPGVRLKGLLLTLKLIDWSLAEQIPDYLARIRSWGCAPVRARQLHHNRREICVAARFDERQ